ncbi:YhgE/Pip domain-containing protein [Nonomuraea sp. NBC_01738]|uniref:YhgE/Pip domain-containing protein n=1 Tax=Nonomuraea sp. NBC_01738 TaxID=2976003 RepID=UPI002E0DE593|nr:YhgE/Pip domain-containing protein [Nonomuraea sp. NBC_01738]
MSPSLGLGKYELRRFRRNPLTRAALIAIVLIPLMYAGLYLWSFWNPLGRVSDVPVALVVLDEGETGRELADTLEEQQAFRWYRVTPEEAEKGVLEGRFYASLTIPADFTARLESPSKDGPPDPAYLDVHVDEGNNYLATIIAKSAFNQVREAVAKSAISAYLDKIFVSFSKLHDSTLEAADGAGKLADGAGQARAGAGTLTDGLASAHAGAETLSSGLGTAGDGAKKLANGLGTAKEGTGSLADGAVKLRTGAGKLQNGLVTAGKGTQALAKGLNSADQGVAKLGAGAAKLDQGAKQLAAGNAEVFRRVHQYRVLVNDLADVAAPFLREHAGGIRRMSEFLNLAATFFADCLEDLPARIQADKVRADMAYQELKTYLDTHPDLDPALRVLLERAVAAAKQLATLADYLDALVDEHLGDLRMIGSDALRVASLARRLALLAPTLGDRVEKARSTFNELDDGLNKLAQGAAKLGAGTGEAVKGVAKLGQGISKLDAGAAKLNAGVGKLVSGAGELGNGLNTLVAGAVKLDDGMGQLVSGANSLNNGLIRLNGGADELSSGLSRLYGGAGDLEGGLGELDRGAGTLATSLSDGAKQIPDYGKKERDERTGMMSDPVRIDTRVSDHVPDYGTGFAPYFLPISLWVGAVITYLVLRPLNPRVLASMTPPWRAALAGWLPAVLVGALEVAAILLVLRFGLGMEADNWAGLIGFLMLTSAAFMAILQALNALLGSVGKVLAIALLVLQLTSAGGTYPVQTSPDFFQTISPYMPMTWVVNAVRRLISGGYAEPIHWGVIGLSIVAAAALALTTLAARKGRLWSISRLHPALTL